MRRNSVGPIAAGFGALILCGAAQARPLDVVFLIDTTGSMSSEIAEAKNRVRQIADALRKQRAPDPVRIGVVAFRDKGDEYLTMHAPLSANVDKAYAFLSELGADGGGDSPEDVLAGLKTALDDEGFTDAAAVDRAIFLIGDAPAHTDYADTPTLAQLTAAARERRIAIHAVGCRSLPPDGVDQFRALAYGTEGSYQHIGRVDVGGGSSSSRRLDQAVLDALDRPAPRAPVVVKLVRKAAAADGSKGIEVTKSTEPAQLDGSCDVEITLPAGVSLTGVPKAAAGKDGVAVILALGAGAGGGGVYALSSCGPAGAPIAVEIAGGAP